MADMFIERLKASLRSRDPKVMEMVSRANQELLNLKFFTPGAVHVDSTLTNVSIQYRNEEFIGTKLMPILPVNKLSGSYFVYNKRDRLAFPETAVNARSVPNEINENRSTSTFSCQGHALLNFIDVSTIKNQDAPLDEMVDLVAAVNDVLELAQEIRIANVLQTAANYGTTLALSGTSRWDTATGNPIGDIRRMVRSTWSGLGSSRLVGFCGPDVWAALETNAAIRDLTKYVSPGLTTATQLARSLGLDDILVGSAKADLANEGQTMSTGDIWGKHFGVIRVANSPSMIRNAAFGFTMQFGDKVTTEWFEPKVSVAGGYYAKVGHWVDHKIVAGDTGVLYTTVVS